MDIIPDRCLNGQGLIVSKNSSGWIDLQSKAKAKTVIAADFVLANTGALSGKVSYTRDGYDAHAMRNQYFKDGEQTYVKNALSGKVWDVTASLFENTKVIEKPALEKHELVIADHSTVAGDQIYVNPFVTAQVRENPFKHESRTYPVDFGKPIEQVYMFKITIPDGYGVDEMPKSKVFMLPGNAARFIYNSNLNGNTLTITSSLQINKSLFVQEEYVNLREFYNGVVAKQNEQIVLKKKLN
jgi:hypothetical protein